MPRYPTARVAQPSPRIGGLFYGEAKLLPVMGDVRVDPRSAPIHPLHLIGDAASGGFVAEYIREKGRDG